MALWRYYYTKKNTDEEKYEYSGYGIPFYSADSWSFVNGSARNLLIFGVDNSSSSHAHNLENKILVLGWRSNIFVLMEALVRQKKSLVLTLVNQIQNFASVCIIMLIVI